MADKITLDDLNRAARDGGPNAMSSVTHLAPAAGEHSLIAPAKYKHKSSDAGVYVHEDRYIGGTLNSTVLVDSRSSVTNRFEEALAMAIEDRHPLLKQIPTVRVTYTRPDGGTVSYADYELPHRTVDGHIRFGKIGAEDVWANRAYVNARNSTHRNAWSLFELSPLCLLFGLWDATRRSDQLRIPSAIVGEVIGIVGDGETDKTERCTHRPRRCKYCAR